MIENERPPGLCLAPGPSTCIKAKPYQVKQVRHVILKYKLGGEPDVEV